MSAAVADILFSTLDEDPSTPIQLFVHYIYFLEPFSHKRLFVGNFIIRNIVGYGSGMGYSTLVYTAGAGFLI